MASSLFGPGRSTGQHTAAAQRERQRRDRMDDTNASTRPNQTTVAEIKARKR